MKTPIYHNHPNFSDRPESDRTAGSTLFAILSASCGPSVIKQCCFNFRIITAIFWGVQIFSVMRNTNLSVYRMSVRGIRAWSGCGTGQVDQRPYLQGGFKTCPVELYFEVLFKSDSVILTVKSLMFLTGLNLKFESE